MIAKSKGFIIGRKIYRETSLLLKLYTYDFGKIEGIVKGVRKIEDYGRYDGMIDLLSNYEIVFYYKRSALNLLVQFYLLDSYWDIFKNYQSFISVSLGIELLDYIMQPYDPNIEVYGLLNFYLKEMSNPSKSRQTVSFYAFIIKLLKYSGFNPQINECVKCRNKIKNRGYFLASEGGLICKDCRINNSDSFPLTRGVIEYINFLEQEPYFNIERLRISQKVRRELNKILFDFLNHHISFIPRSWRQIESFYD